MPGYQGGAGRHIKRRCTVHAGKNVETKCGGSRK